ncbi:MAG: hypothetical protein QXT34_02605 [Candidatus Aenigmatarchaeota archaeon]
MKLVALIPYGTLALSGIIVILMIIFGVYVIIDSIAEKTWFDANSMAKVFESIIILYSSSSYNINSSILLPKEECSVKIESNQIRVKYGKKDVEIPRTVFIPNYTKIVVTPIDCSLREVKIDKINEEIKIYQN